MKILHINSSTRGAKSESLSLAQSFISELQVQHAVEVDVLNLFDADLPPFDGLAVGAKMAVFTGNAQNDEQKAVWLKIKALFDRFAAADAYVIYIPLWNSGIPYILKQFIDLVTQPGWLFGFDGNMGYTGLLHERKAYVFYASGVYYDGIPAGFGSDFATPYMDDWLKFIGVDRIEHVHMAPTVVNQDFSKTKDAALSKAVALARKTKN